MNDPIGNLYERLDSGYKSLLELCGAIRDSDIPSPYKESILESLNDATIGINDALNKFSEILIVQLPVMVAKWIENNHNKK
jgi:hypothetical protein